MECDACGAEVLDIDVKCPSCGRHLTSTGAHELIGQVVLGTYELTDILGQGGMSVVYKARHRMTEQEVALKILPPELAAHSQVKSRFLEEARALAALDHPNIVHLYNFGQEGSSFVLAMQFVRGTTFERLILEAGELHWGLAAGICIDVLKALEYAHSRGVIHRDMKPSNILVREDDGSATVMDFGIAKMTTSTKLTATGQTMGTVRYMSPEQVRGKEVDVRTDIYSLGASLYEALVGETPFDGETHFEIMTKHLNEPPVPPSVHGVHVPGAMERAIMRSLAKAPDDRFATARDFRDALEAALVDGDLGEAETLRMTRDLVMSIPKGNARPTESLADLASALEPTGEGENFEEGTDVIPAGARRKPVLWVALAGLVAVATAVVGVIVVRGDGSGKAASPPPVADARSAPALVEPFRFDDTAYAVEQVFEPDKLRVMSIEAADPGELRAQVQTGLDRFAAFLRERGHNDPLAVQPMTIQRVPREYMCRDALYTDSPGSKSCDNEAWYRAREQTLVVAQGEKQEISVIVNVAFAICLQQRITLCDAKLLQDFEARLTPAPGVQPDEKQPKRGPRK